MATAEERKKLAAEQYLAENQVRWLLEHVTADLIHFTPTNPYKFIAKRVKDIQEHGATPIHRHQLVAIVGGPASGKGMACAHLAQELGTVTVAPAELLRNEVKDGTDMGKRVGELLHANAVVPKEFVTELMRKKLNAFTGNPSDEPTYVLDGFPRTLEQALHFESNGTEISKVVWLSAPDDVLLKRISRHQEGHDGETESPEALAAKIRDFKRNTLPVIEYYRALGKLTVLDATQEPAAVMAAVEKVVRK